MIIFRPNLEKRRSYGTDPKDINLERGLDMIFSRRDLRVVMRYALTRQSWIAEFGWGGIEYPSRADRSGMVRYCWLPNPDARRLRKCHAPESEYLGLLLGVAKHLGWQHQIVALEKLNPDAIDVRLTPDVFELENYRVRGVETLWCLATILSIGDFALAQAWADSRTGYDLIPQREGVIYSAIKADYLKDGIMRLQIADQERLVHEKKYLEVLEKLLSIHKIT